MDNDVKSIPFFDIDMPKLNKTQNIAITIIDYLYFHDITALEKYSEEKNKFYSNLVSSINNIIRQRNYTGLRAEVYVHFLICGLEMHLSQNNYVSKFERLMSLVDKKLPVPLFTRICTSIEENQFKVDEYKLDIKTLLAEHAYLGKEKTLRYKLASQLLYFEYDLISIGVLKKFLDINILESKRYQFDKSQVSSSENNKLFLRAMLFIEFENQKNKLFIENKGNFISLEISIGDEDKDKKKLYMDSKQKMNNLFDFKNNSISKIDIDNKFKIQEYLENIDKSFGHNRLLFHNLAICIGLLGAWYVRYFYLIDLKKAIYRDDLGSLNTPEVSCCKEAKTKLFEYGFTLSERTLYEHYKVILDFYWLINYAIDEILAENSQELAYPSLVSYFFYEPETGTEFKRILESIKNRLKKV